MRILYIHQFFAMRDSSHPTRSYEFARRMVAAGHEVWMLTGSSRLPEPHTDRLVSRFETDGIKVVSVRNTYSNYMGTTARILSFVRFMLAATWIAATVPRPDVVFATSTPLTVTVPGIVASRVRRSPYVFEVRDPWPDAAFEMKALEEASPIGRASRWLERVTYRAADRIVALSPGMVEYVLRQGADPGKLTMIPNCSDLDLFRPGDKDDEIVDRFGLAGTFVVGYSGAIGPSNAVHVIAQAARVLKERGERRVRILIAGDGKDLPKVLQLKEDAALDNLLIAGSIPKQEMPRFLRTCDVLLVHFAKVPVLYTNSPNKLFDGLAAGRPIIVNSPGWTKPLIESNDAGLFVEPEDPEALADAIISLANDPDAVERMGHNSRALAEREFDRDVQARRLLSLLEESASRSS